MKRHWSSGWQGGRFDANAAERFTMLSENARLCGVFGVSEALDTNPIKGWGMSRGECAATWDSTVWKLKDHGVVHVNTNKWKRGTSWRRTVDFYWTLLEHKDGWTLLVVYAHLPAHLYLPWQRLANSKALRDLSAVIKALRVQTGADEVDLAMDANRDMRRATNIKLMKKSLRTTGLRLVVPPEATHGKKAKIDLRATTADTVGAGRMFRWHSGYDHRGFRNAQSSEAA
jgi:hypothetical protein